MPYQGANALLKTVVRRLVGLTPYRISSGPANRFDAIEPFLHHVAQMGLRPRRIIDGGAHLGTFARAAREAFPAAEIHMVEPQPACAARLRELASSPGFHLHPVALTGEKMIVHMIALEEPDTSAHIAWEGARHLAKLDVQGETLDALFADDSTPEDRLLLKLDLQGHELLALKGASRLLESVEVILTEVSFFVQAEEPTVSELVSFLNDVGFDLFDVVGVSGRARDERARQGDFVFVRRQTPLWADRGWK